MGTDEPSAVAAQSPGRELAYRIARRDHGHEQDAPDDADQQRLPGQQAEDEDADDDEDDQELRAAAGVRGGVAPDALDGQGLVVLESSTRMPPKGRNCSTRVQLMFCPRESARAAFKSCSLK